MMLRNRKIRKHVLLFWLLGLSIGSIAFGADDPAKITVKGTGVLQDLRMNRLLREFMAEERVTGQLSGASVVDGAILLRSRLRKDGYLEPVIEGMAAEADGSETPFRIAGEALPEIPLEKGYQRVHYRVEPGIRYYYESVEFEGLEYISLREARAYFYPQDFLFQTKNTRPYSPESNQSALNNLRSAYHAMGYRKATIEVLNESLDESTGAVSVRIGVNAGPQHVVTHVHEFLEGEGTDAAEAVLNSREMDAEKFTPGWQREVQLNARVRFYEAGYPDAKVSLKTRPESDSVDEVVKLQAELSIQPGPRVRVNLLEYEGLVHTKMGTVTDQVDVGAGEWLSRVELESSKRALSALSIFDSVSTRLDPVPSTEGVDEPVELRDVTFTFDEANRREYFVRVGYGSYEQLRTGLEVTQNNILGRAHRSRLMLRYSMKSSSVEWIYSIPRLWNRDLRWNTSIDWLNREEVSFERKEWGLETGLDTVIRPLDARARISYKLESLESRNITLVDLGGDEKSRSGSVEFSLLRDKLDNPIVPTDGYRVRFSSEVAAEFLGSETDYQIHDFSLAYHRSFDSGWRLHSRLNHRVVFSLNSPENQIPFNKRIFPGGENSIRGYLEGEASFRNENEVFTGASSATLASVEMERVLMGDFLGVLFVDGLLQGENEADYPGNEFLSSVGLGIRYNSPVGPLRLEYGYNLNPRPLDPDGALHFSLGFPF